jgi:hypothetical protein
MALSGHFRVLKRGVAESQGTKGNIIILKIFFIDGQNVSKIGHIEHKSTGLLITVTFQPLTVQNFYGCESGEYQCPFHRCCLELPHD